MIKDYVMVIFDANGGGITVSSKRLTQGEPYGELPTPTWFGYEFNGWFTAEQGGELVGQDTIVTAEHSFALWAHWTKNVQSDAKLQAYRKKKAVAKRQKTIIVIASLLVLLLIAGLFVVMHYVNRTNLEDYDGTVYKIIKKGGIYILCDEDEIALPLTEDGKYYITAAGSQIKLDPQSGQSTVYAYVPVVGREAVGNFVTARVLAFPQIQKVNMSRLEIHNDYGTYALIGTHNESGKDGKRQSNYYIEGHKDTAIQQELFSSLIVSCGYVLAMDKIDEPIKDENGEYSEYGLTAQTKYDEDGNPYEYTPAWYRLTDVNGHDFTVIVGNAIVSGAGYYIQYLNPDYPDTPFIYIVSSEIAKTVLQPVEVLVQPMIVYPVSLSTYFDVQNFSIVSVDSDIVVKFSFVPNEDRFGTLQATVPYVFLNEEFKHFNASSVNIDTCLQSFVNMPFLRVVKLAPDEEALITYGVDDPSHVIYFERNVNEPDFTGTINTLLTIGQMTPHGTHYIYSTLFNMIVEVDRTYLPYLNWEPLDWLDSTAYTYNLAGTSQIALSSGGKNVLMDIDNSDSKQFTYSALDASSYTHIDREGLATNYYLVGKSGAYSVSVGAAGGISPDVFAKDVRYLLTKEGKLYLIENTATTTLDMTSGTSGTGTLYATSYDKNLDSYLYIFVDNNTGKWGRVKRDLSSDAVRVTAKVDDETPIELITPYFRHFFQTILYASTDGICNLTEDEMAALRALPDSEAQLVLAIKTEEGEDVFKFYRYSERRSYMTIDGSGIFYIISDRVEKIFGDALKVIAGEDVSATSKY